MTAALPNSPIAAELRHVEGQLKTATAWRRARLLDLRRQLLDRLADVSHVAAQEGNGT